MTQLEDKLSDGYYVHISTNNVDYSHFDLNKFKEKINTHLFDDKSQFGIIIEDENKKITELVGVFRYFNKKAQLIKPAKLLVDKLYDENIVFSDNLLDQLESFLKKLGQIDPPTKKYVTCWEGEFKKVEITKIMPEKKWWTKMFIDLYVENTSVINKLNSMNEISRKILNKSNEWKRYEQVRNYVGSLHEKMILEKNDRIIPQDKILCFLNYHAPYNQPVLFRNSEDYKYFLLGFYHTGFDIKNIHDVVLCCLKEQTLLEKHISTFNTNINELNVFSKYEKLKLDKKYKLFANDMSEKELIETYEKVEKSGNKIKRPLTIPEELWDLGFLPLKRDRWRDIKPSKESYALIKIKGTPSYIQRKLPFEEKEQHIKLKRDYPSRKESIFSEYNEF